MTQIMFLKGLTDVSTPIPQLSSRFQYLISVPKNEIFHSRLVGVNVSALLLSALVNTHLRFFQIHC